MGDRSVLIFLRGDDITVLCRHIHALDSHLNKLALPGVVETVPAYKSLAVYYLPSKIGVNDLCARLSELTKSVGNDAAETARTVEIPVCFDGVFGSDVTEVASIHSLSVDRLLNTYLSAVYTVAMIGFTPGFPYLLGLPERLATPRRRTPRQLVAAGSVGIGGSQTGIYSLDSPGGWNIIGRTPLRLFLAETEEPTFLRAGDIVRFQRIDESTFDSIKKLEL